MSKIAVILRVRDEERNIGQFVEAYQSWVDYILIADGGSEDNTLSVVRGLMEVYDNVLLRHFDERDYVREGAWRNPEGRHINFLLDWAEELKVDWVIFDDCDCRPNYLVKKEGREIIENCQEPLILITRLYLWKGTGKHLSHLAQPAKEGVWEPSLWAWRLDTGLRADNNINWDISFNLHIDDFPQRRLLPPYCLLHSPWPDEAEINRKMLFYNKGYWADGNPRRFNYPLMGESQLSDLPAWAREEE